jgi:uridine kinase
MKIDKYDYPRSSTLGDLAHIKKIEGAVCASISHRLRELSYPLSNIKDNQEIEFLTTKDKDAIPIYQATLRYVIAYAISNLYPKLLLKYNYSVSRSILGILEGENAPKIDDTFIKNLTKEVNRLIKLDLSIQRYSIPIEEARAIYIEKGLIDKAAILNYRQEKFVNVYKCADYYNYMFGYLMPSTGYIKDFNLLPYKIGFIIQYPRYEFGGIIPKFVESPIYNNTLKDAFKWTSSIGGDTISTINHLTTNSEEIADFVNICETKHNNMLCNLGDHISANRNKIDLIAIAGPSSSGKTTFTNRVRIELMTRGIKPVMISLDNYYLPREQVPKDENNEPDFEDINALDIEQFNIDLNLLLTHQEVHLFKFDFKLGKRVEYKVVKLSPDSPIIIEGIHALNDLMTPSIPRNRKFKVYISPQTQVHIDNQNPIGITDLRLVRRIVRDMKYRNATPEITLNMWSSVRQGEFKWIYPFEEEADFVFNTELTYELAVLKKHALSALRSIPSESEYFITANRLVKFLKYFNDIADELVPANSLLREFIGGSSFN